MQVSEDSSSMILFLALATLTSSVSEVYGIRSLDDLENKQSTGSDLGNPSHPLQVISFVFSLSL